MGFIPLKKTQNGIVLDGALMGAGSLKAVTQLNSQEDLAKIWLQPKYESKKLKHSSMILATYLQNHLLISDDFALLFVEFWFLKISKST